MSALRRPKAKTKDVLVEELPEELLLFDRARNRAHCLNRAAGVVWRACDGHRTVPQIAAVTSAELGEPIGDEVVEVALAQLAEARLVEDGGGPRVDRQRRKMIRNLLIAPAVLTVLAPTAARAATCTPRGAQCQRSSQCCPGLTCKGTIVRTCQ
jgi:hypothetical protein